MRWQIGFCVVFLGVCLTQPAWGQSLLERLERRLNEALPPTPAAPKATESEPDSGESQPGSLGLIADAIDNAVIVHMVHTGGPADLAGLRRGDRLVSAGGVELTNLDDLAGVLGKLPPGARVEFVVERDGVDRKLVATLGEPNPKRQASEPEKLPAPADPLLNGPLEPQTGAILGVRAGDVTADAQQRYGLTVRQGAVIEAIQEGSPAARYGLPLGAAIVALDGARVDSADDLAQLIGGYRPGDFVEITYYVRDRAFRKQVRLAPTAVAATPAPGGDRPLLRTLERALDGVVVPPAGNNEVQTLRAQVSALGERVEVLEARIAELEARLDAAQVNPGPKLQGPVEPLVP